MVDQPPAREVNLLDPWLVDAFTHMKFFPAFVAPTADNVLHWLTMRGADDPPSLQAFDELLALVTFAVAMKMERQL